MTAIQLMACSISLPDVLVVILEKRGASGSLGLVSVGFTQTWPLHMTPGREIQHAQSGQYCIQTCSCVTASETDIYDGWGKLVGSSEPWYLVYTAANLEPAVRDQG